MTRFPSILLASYVAAGIATALARIALLRPSGERRRDPLAWIARPLFVAWYWMARRGRRW